MRSRFPDLAAIALLAALVAALALASGGGDPPPAEPSGELTGRVVEVTDGDTVRVDLDGSEERVRYIGIDTPEVSAQPSECFGEEATRRNRALVAGERVRLVPGAEQRDHYGRLLAYVYVGDAFVNAELVREGFARTLEVAPNTRHAGLLARLQQQAANAGRGLWGAC